MSILQNIRKKAASNQQRIVLPEGYDPRILKAAELITSQRLAQITVLGEEQKILQLATEHGVDLRGVSLLDPKSSSEFEKMVSIFYELRKPKGITTAEARKTVSDPVYYAALMVRGNLADGSVGGAQATTAHTVKAALQCIGIESQYRIVSSFFIMVLNNQQFGESGALLFADCGVVIDPTVSELAEIAIASAESFQALIGSQPRVAMLSFSTKGSASHKLVDKVTEATRTVKARRPDLLIDGELQADAALIPLIAEQKAPGSSVAGRANVLIFPDLQSGNIGYKLVERLAGATAIGPVLQGLEKPANDLSRGCKVDDIIDAVAITALQSIYKK
jgi:phosphate acetyltransferase